MEASKMAIGIGILAVGGYLYLKSQKAQEAKDGGFFSEGGGSTLAGESAPTFVFSNPDVPAPQTATSNPVLGSGAAPTSKKAENIAEYYAGNLNAIYGADIFTVAGPYKVGLSPGLSGTALPVAQKILEQATISNPQAITSLAGGGVGFMATPAASSGGSGGGSTTSPGTSKKADTVAIGSSAKGGTLTYTPKTSIAPYTPAIGVSKIK